MIINKMQTSLKQRKSYLETFEGAREEIKTLWKDKNELQEQEKRLREEIEDLEKKNGVLERTSCSIIEDLEKGLESKFQSLSERVRTLKSGNAGLIEEVKRQNQENSAQTANIEELEKQQRCVSEENIRLESARGQKLQETLQIENKNRILQEQLTLTEVDMEKAKREIEALEDELNTLQASFEEKEKERKEKEKKKNQCRKETAKLRNRISNLGKERLNLKGLLNSVREQVEDFEDKIALRRREICKLDDKIGKEQRRYAASECLFNKQEVESGRILVLIDVELKEIMARTEELTVCEKMLKMKEDEFGKTEKKHSKLSDVVRKKKDGWVL